MADNFQGTGFGGGAVIIASKDLGTAQLQKFQPTDSSGAEIIAATAALQTAANALTTAANALLTTMSGTLTTISGNTPELVSGKVPVVTTNSLNVATPGTSFSFTSATSATFLAANASRKNFTIANTGTSALHLIPGAGPAVVGSCPIVIQPLVMAELDPAKYGTGQFTGILAAAGSCIGQEWT